MRNKPKVFTTSLMGGQLERVKFRLSRKTRAGIAQALKMPAKDPATKQFLKLLESDLGSFAVLEAQRAKLSSLKHQVAELDKLSAAIVGMRTRIGELDALSQRILDQAWISTIGIGPSISASADDSDLPRVTLPSPLDDFDQDARSLLVLLEALSSESRKHIKPGAPLKKERQHLIDNMLRHYQQCFGRLPSSANEGPFEQALRLFLESIRIFIEDLHSEVVQSLKRIRGK